MDDYVVVEAHGKRYGVLAVAGDDGLWRPDVCELGPDGGPVRQIVGSDWTDEEAGDARTCLLRAMVHVI